MTETESSQRIVIVDGDAAALEPVCQRLGVSGFDVSSVDEADAAAALRSDKPPDLVMVDLDTPGFMVLDLLNRVRAAQRFKAIRLIILSVTAGENDVVAALNSGADDFIAKPFSVSEVVARVRAVLRLRKPVDRCLVSCGSLILDPTASRLTVKGEVVRLPGIEYRLLEFLMENVGRTFNREQLLRQVWGEGAGVDERTVDVNVQRLRKILTRTGHGDCLQTVRGFGYRFAAPDAT